MLVAGLAESSLGGCIHLDVEAGPSVQLGHTHLVVLVSLDVPACHLNGQRGQDVAIRSDEIVGRGIHFGILVFKDSLEGTFSVQSDADGPGFNRVELAQQLKGHKHSHDSSQFRSVGVLFVRIPGDHIGPSHIVESLVPFVQLGDDEA